MADAHHAAANRQLRMLLETGTVVGLTDGQLLELFESRRDETAFTALVERHGPMVRRVCGEVLGNHHDAEDAFQATFLVLARQVGSIRRRGSVASWLYGVALRVSACARSVSARRRKHERNWVALRTAQLSSEGESREDFGPDLHAEIGRLADRFRAPVVLCYLEGRTHEEAARLLRCPVGTIKSRLATARQRIRQRLEPLEPVWLTGSVERDQGIEPAVVAVPARLVETTVRAATQGGADGVVPVAVARLVEGVLKAMFLNRVSAVAAASMVVAALATGASGWAWQAKGGGDAANAKADKPPQAKPAGRTLEPQPPVRASNLTNLAGRVIDEQGKPVGDAQVFFFAPNTLLFSGNGDPVEVRTQTDASGQYRLALPPMRQAAMKQAHVWAYRPGSAIAVTPQGEPSAVLVLRRAQPKVVKVEESDGQPVAGASLSAILIADGDWPAAVPGTLARPLFVTTGPDGKATFDYLAGGDKLVTVRVSHASIGSQNLQLFQGPMRDVQDATITNRLPPTRHLTGHVRDRAGQAVAGQTVEVWSAGGRFLPPSLVEFKNGPLRTAVDGSFRTPDNLFVGSQYRVAVRAPEFEPMLSEWITISEEPRVLLPLIQRPLRTLSGRVVDRQGKPLSSVEVFQSGDGPERTTTRTDREGRFALGGFREGPVFLFARGEGFRFFGRLIKSGDGDITVELTRIGERPAPEMRMLPEPIPLEESRALVRRLIEPYWKAAVAQKNEKAAVRALDNLAAADPVGTLQKMEGEEILTPVMTSGVRYAVARALARSDPDRAQKVAESIEEPSVRSMAFLAVTDALPVQERDRKLALLARAALAAKAEQSPYRVAEIAERWYELGEKDKAKALLAESVRLRPDDSRRRGLFAARLALVDLPAALAIAKELSLGRHNAAPQILWNIAFRMAAHDPAEAERVLRLVPQEPGKLWLHPAIVWKMAQAAPARARRLADEAQHFDDEPETYLFLALGLKARDPAAAEQALWKAIEGIDRLMNEGTDTAAIKNRLLLPLVEQIDPSLVPEVFWRAVAMRPPLGDLRYITSSRLVPLLGWYDREVAATLFEPERVQMERTNDGELALGRLATGSQRWSIIDPRAAVARLEQMPTTVGDQEGLFAKQPVAELLGLSYEDRWRRVWTDYTDMRYLLERDIQ
jgi:RNA polymerase sigma factor (sigma-70 family)